MRGGKSFHSDDLFSRSTELRLKALECLHQAELSRSPDTQATFTFLAAAYAEMAGDLEETEQVEMATRGGRPPPALTHRQ